MTAHLYRETYNMSVFSVLADNLCAFFEADLVDKIEGQLTSANPLQLPLSFDALRIVVVVSTLFHISYLDAKYKRSVIRESFYKPQGGTTG